MAVLSEEQVMLKDSARDWVSAQAPVAALRRLRDDASGRGFEPATWAAMGEMGWAGVIVPEAHGGSDFGYASLGIVLEETGRTLAASPLLSTGLIGASALLLGGSSAQQAEWLPKIAAAEVVVALALEESAHHDPTKAAAAVKDGVLEGRKTFVLDGMEADLLLVVARTAGGLGLFLVPAGAEGVSRTRLETIDSRGAAEIGFSGVKLAPDAGLAGGDALVEQVLDRARAGAAAEMLGTALQAFETTLAYLKTRTQFGQLIGGFQVMQHRAARMFTELELTRSCVEAALQAIDGGSNDARALCSLAKAKASETLHAVSNDMVQMHGGIGMTDAADAGLYLKRARLMEAAFGGASFHRDRYARLMGF